MASLGMRIVMAVIGLSVLALYTLAAIGVVLAGEWVLAAQPNPLVTIVVFFVTMAVVGYLSFKAGTARLLANLSVVEIDRARARDLYRRLDRLVERMAVHRPTLCLADLGAPNALSVGTNGATIVLDRRLFGLLTADELEGIVAHELAHVESSDSLIKTLAVSAASSVIGVVFLFVLPVTLALTGVARAVAWGRGRPTEWDRTIAGAARRWIEIGVLGLMSVLTLALLAHSRRREFAADQRAAEVTEHPLALARALHKIDRARDPNWGVLAPLYISGDEEGPLSRMLSTHPPMDQRIDRLLTLADRRPTIGA